MSTEDLLDYYKLEAEVFPEHTLHFTYKINRARGGRERIEKQWKRMESIGEGFFGQVWRELHCREDGRQEVRAVKAITKQRIRGVDFKKELLALAKFSKPEYQQAEVFVSFFGWFESDSSIFLAMEFFGNGDLAQHIPNISTEDEVRKITTDLLDGLSIMHAEGFAHRDLKPQNIFVAQMPPQSEIWWVKIGDFGISKRVKNEDTALRTQTGTPYFQAPEIQGFIDDSNESSEYSNAVDIWSLGCVVYNIAARKVPFLTPKDTRRFCQKISLFPEEPLATRMSETGIGFVKRLLVPEPVLRLSAENALKDPWMMMSSLTIRHKLEPTASSTISKMATEIVGPARYSSSSQNYNSDRTIKPKQVPVYSNSGPPGTLNTSIMHSPAQTPSTSNSPPTSSFFNSGSEPSDSWRTQIQIPTYKLLNPGAMTTKTVSPKPEALHPSSISEPRIPRYWKQAKTLKGHGDSVWSVAFSPDGRQVASGSRDKTVRLWDSATGSALQTLTGHGDSVESVAFSPDGRQVASGSWDKTVRLWDSATGSALQTLTGHGDSVWSVAFSPDGRQVASGSRDKTVRLWDSATGSALQTLTGHGDSVWSVAFSPDGRQVASGSWDKTVRLWDSATGSALQTLTGHGDSVESVAFSPDGRQVASGSRDKTVRLWDSATGSALQTLTGHGDSVWSVAFSPDGRQVASGSRDKTVRLWDSATGSALQTLTGHGDSVWSVAFSPDGRQVASGSRDKTVRLWDSATGISPAKKPPAKKSAVRNYIEKLF